MLTISQLAKRFGLTRTTLLYYEKEGLLTPTLRNSKGYRQYSDLDVLKLANIVAYRSYGISVGDIKKYITEGNAIENQYFVQAILNHLEKRVEQFRRSQNIIMRILKVIDVEKKTSLSKEEWSENLVKMGVNEQETKSWHQQFEELSPQQHYEFLESLEYSNYEIDKLRVS